MGNFSLREKKILSVFSVIVIFLLAVIYGEHSQDDKNFLVSNSFNREEVKLGTSQEEKLQETSAQIEEDIYIHITGAVRQNGLIKIPKDSRMVDAIEAAGGFLEGADVGQINLSRKVQDEEQIHVPLIGEQTAIYAIGSTGEDEVSTQRGKVNINTCEKTDLMTLPGIGDKTADKIIKYRMEHRFQKIEDLKEVPGIGDKKFDELKDLITI